jgi:GNAT superfamily N-acetyltransferase
VQEEVYVALSEGRLVGLASFYRPDSFLHSLYVDYAEHGRGVGSALLGHIEAIADAPVSLKVQIRNLQARDFYERKGLKISEEVRMVR